MGSAWSAAESYVHAGGRAVWIHLTHHSLHAENQIAHGLQVYAELSHLQTSSGVFPSHADLLRYQYGYGALARASLP